MRAQGSGRIVNVGSLAGIVASPFRGIYSATKAAVEAITDAMYYELHPIRHPRLRDRARVLRDVDRRQPHGDAPRCRCVAVRASLDTLRDSSTKAPAGSFRADPQTGRRHHRRGGDSRAAEAPLPRRQGRGGDRAAAQEAVRRRVRAASCAQTLELLGLALDRRTPAPARPRPPAAARRAHVRHGDPQPHRQLVLGRRHWRRSRRRRPPRGRCRAPRAPTSSTLARRARAPTCRCATPTKRRSSSARPCAASRRRRASSSRSTRTSSRSRRRRSRPARASSTTSAASCTTRAPRSRGREVRRGARHQLHVRAPEDPARRAAARTTI